MNAKSPVHRNLVMLLLFLIYVSNTLDRYVIAFLAEPIRRELDLSDTQLGLLTGFVFAVFYTFCGIPVGWLADRFGRIRVMMVAAILWSSFSALGGFARNFFQLALARVGVGVGEAGGAAPSYSLISSFFGPKERGGAIGLFSLGSPVSALIGSAACAWIAAHFGWRTAVVVVSLPGVVVAIILYLVVPEPAGEVTRAPASLRMLGRDVLEFFATPILRTAAIVAGLSSFGTFAMAAWLPSLMMRAKGMSLQEFGTWYGIAYALSFGFGLWFGGYLSDRLAVRSERAYALVPCCGLLLAVPFMLLGALLPDWHVSLCLWMVPVASVAMFLAPMVTLIQNTSASERRSTFSAAFLFVNNLVGSGLGPLYVGMISDHFRPEMGNQALTYGLAACAPIALIASCGQYVLSRMLGRKRAELSLAE